MASPAWPLPPGGIDFRHPHGYLADRATDSMVRCSSWMLDGAGLALAEGAEADRPRPRKEWGYLIRRSISGVRIN